MVNAQEEEISCSVSTMVPWWESVFLSISCCLVVDGRSASDLGLYCLSIKTTFNFYFSWRIIFFLLLGYSQQETIVLLMRMACPGEQKLLGDK